jgi:hypothetical protein
MRNQPRCSADCDPLYVKFAIPLPALTSLMDKTVDSMAHVGSFFPFSTDTLKSVKAVCSDESFHGAYKRLVLDRGRHSGRSQ